MTSKFLCIMRPWTRTVLIGLFCLAPAAQWVHADTCSSGGGCPSGFPNYSQPTNQTACTGNAASFSVAPSDGDQYAWEFSSDGSVYSPIIDGGAYSGTTTDTLHVDPASAAEAGHYRCVVGCSVSGNECTSNDATLVLDAAPNVGAGGPYTTCGASPVTIGGTSNDSDVVWSTSGTGTFGDANALSTTYTPSPADVTAGSVTLTLTAGCAPNTSSSNAALTIDPPPTADAGGPYTTCGTNSVSISGTATNAASTNWTTSGTGIFGDASLLSTTYTPSAADVTAGSATLTLHAAAPGCTPNEVVSNATLTINKITVSAGGPYGTCGTSLVNISGSATNATSTAWSSSGTGTFGDAALLNTTYTPSAADVLAGSVTLTLTGDNAACTPDSASSNATLTIDVLTADAGGPYSTCETTSVPLSGTAANQTGVFWSTSGTGTFTNGTSLNAEYNPSAADLTAGSITLTLTSNAAACTPNFATSNATLTLQKPPTAEAGGPYLSCNTVAVSLSGTAVNQSTVSWSTSGTGTFTNGDTLTATYLPSAIDVASGSVTLTLTADPVAPCSTSATSQATLTLQQLPFSATGPDQAICPGQSVTLAGAVSQASGFSWSGGAGVFSPNNTTLDAIYTPTPTEANAGSVILTLTAHPTAPCLLDAVDTMQITINPLPDPSLALGATKAAVCSGGTSAVTVAGSHLGMKYRLRNDADDSNVGRLVAGTGGTIELPTSPITGPTTFNVLAIDDITGCSQQLTATQMITLLPATAVTLQPSNAVAVVSAGASATATFSVLAQGLNLTYQWKLSTNGGTDYATIPGATAATHTTDALTLADDGNMYRCVVTGDCGQAYSDWATLSVHDADGVDNAIEDFAPNGGDGNGDGIPDRKQPNVTSLPDVNGDFVTVISSPDTELVSVVTYGSPSPEDSPKDATFPAGLLNFNVTGLSVGGLTQVQILLPPGVHPNTYYKYGPEPGNPLPHWYEFVFDGTTGAQISDDVIMLFFVDGQRGDDDLTANGVIVDLGAPAISTRNPACDNPVLALLSPVCGFGCIVSLIGTFAGIAAMKTSLRRRRR